MSNQRITPVYFKVKLDKEFKLPFALAFKECGYMADDFVKFRMTCVHRFISAN